MNDNENETTFLINKNVIIHNYKNYSKIGNVFYPFGKEDERYNGKYLTDNTQNAKNWIAGKINIKNT